MGDLTDLGNAARPRNSGKKPPSLKRRQMSRKWKIITWVTLVGVGIGHILLFNLFTSKQIALRSQSNQQVEIPTPSTVSDRGGRGERSTTRPVDPATPIPRLVRRPAPPVVSKRAPIPPQSERDEALMRIDELYAEKLSSNDPTVKRGLIAELTKQGQANSGNSAAERHVLLCIARSVAERQKQAQDAIEAIQELAQQFDVNASELRLETARKLREAGLDAASTAHVYLQIADLSLTEGDADASVKALDSADSLLPEITDRAAATDLENKVAAVRSDVADLRQLQPQEAKLKILPDDPDANLAVGWFWAVKRSDWTKGLPYLAKSSVSAIKPAAVTELSNVVSAVGQADLADKWWALARIDGFRNKEVASLRRHAAEWYAKALPGLSGLQAKDAEFRITKSKAELPTLAQTRPIETAVAVDPKEKPLPVADRADSIVPKDADPQDARPVATAGDDQPTVIAKEFTEDLGRGSLLKLLRIEPGEFDMGSPQSEQGRNYQENVHRVKLTKPFLMGIYPITQRQYQTVTGENPSHHKGDELPLEGVSWEDAMAFCQKLSTKTGHRYRLPSEAEWEYTCRAGAGTAFNLGNTDADLGEAAWYKGNSGGKTHPVGQKKPNKWGLYDMHGNVKQWCLDAYADYPQGEAIDPVVRTLDAKAWHVERGGSWNSLPPICRSALRYSAPPNYRTDHIGIRVVFDLSAKAGDKISIVARSAPTPTSAPAVPAAGKGKAPATANAPLRILVHGLGGKDFIDPVSFGPDWRGRNKPGTADPRTWLAPGDFACPIGHSFLTYPPIPASRFVFEADVEFLAKDSYIKVYLGDFDNAPILWLAWAPAEQKVNTNLHFYSMGILFGGGSPMYDLGSRVPMKVVVADGRQMLVINGRPVRPMGGFPSDCTLRIESGGNLGIIHSCSLRPLTEEDDKQCGWEMPPTELKLDDAAAAARLKQITDPLPRQPRIGASFVAATTGTPMAWAAPGEFEMGSHDPAARGLHHVRLTYGFWIGQTEVTQGEYTKLTGSNPSRIRGSVYLPVDTVTWEDALKYCAALTAAEQHSSHLPGGFLYRLPTEAEWEYACRAGSNEDYSVPKDQIWSEETSGHRPHQVAERVPNKWGLYDMHGNAMEWCLDAWRPYPAGALPDAVDPFALGRAGTDTFVCRGGAWFRALGNCSSHERDGNPSHVFRGFRIVLAPALKSMR